MGDYNYGPVKSAKMEKGSEHITEDKHDGWTSSENMVINVDPFNHDTYGNPGSTPQSDHTSELEPAINGQDVPAEDASEHSDLPPVPEHITGDSFSGGEMHKEKKPKMDVKRYPCLTCHKRFSSFEGLRLHSSVHSGNRPHVCGICNKAFMRKRELDRHMATHTGMRPFKCTSCEKSFGRKDKLVRHMRIHDINREHVCVLCGASFNRKDGLTHHMKTHVKEDSDTVGNNV